MLQSMGSQRVRHNLVTEQQYCFVYCSFPHLVVYSKYFTTVLCIFRLSFFFLIDFIFRVREKLSGRYNHNKRFLEF